MKKILCFCAAGLMIAALSTSCNKKCECTTYAAGISLVTVEYEVESGKKCSDYNTYNEELETGVKCHSKF